MSRRAGKANDHTGQHFGHLTATERGEDQTHPNGKRTVRWWCDCECGARTLVAALSLTSGHTTSCGCQERRTHGLSDHPEYKLWHTMIGRCTNPRSNGYRWYGGRGISVYPQWMDDPWPFIEYLRTDLGPRPAGYQLDRIDNDGNYEPGNLRWVTCKENLANRRTVVRLQATVDLLEAENADLRKQLAARRSP